MKNGLVLAALSLAILGIPGCANRQPPAQPAPAPAPEVGISASPGGLLVSGYHPDTRTAYVWYGDPRPSMKRPLSCVKIEVGSDEKNTSKAQECPK